MDSRIIREEITALINNIKSHSDNVSDYERIPQLELELILSKIKKLYEKSVIFNYLYEHDKISFMMDDDDDDDEKVAAPEPLTEPVKREAIEEKVEMPKEEIIISEEQVIQKPLKSVDGNAFKEEMIVEKKTGDINSKLKNSSSDLNEKIGKNKIYASISAKMQMNPISDISKGMGINEKFYYANELFNGNSEAFQKSVSILNSFNNLAEAEHYIKESLADQYKWNFDSFAVKNFLELVQRRYL
jgi:hypothetical protein